MAPPITTTEKPAKEELLGFAKLPAISANKKAVRFNRPAFLSFLNKVSLKDKIVFTEQLDVMIRSGLSIGESLESLAEESENKYFQSVIQLVMADVQGGKSLSDSLNKHPKVFNDIYCNLIRSGEQSGKIDVVLGRLSTQLTKDYELNRKVRGALAYPAFVLSALLIVMVIVLVYIMPQLKAIFDDAGVALPPVTRFVLALSDLLSRFGIFVLIAAISGAVLIVRWHKTKKGKKFFDQMILWIPVIGTLLKKSYMARFSRTFSSLLSSGLPILEAIKVSSDVIGNSIYQEEISKISPKIKSGMPMSQVFKSSKIFPGIVGSLAIVGEKSGSLDEVFDSLANFFERDVENIAANLSSLLEPFLILIMGAGIGGLIIAVLQPIYGLVNAI